MDIGTVIGLILGTVLVFGSIVATGGSLEPFWDTASFLMVVLGSSCAVLASYPIKHITKLFEVVKKTIFNNNVDMLTSIEQVVSLAETARREGILSLEHLMNEIDDDFLKLGIRMAIDGMGPDIVENIMRTEIEAVSGRHDAGKAILESYAKFCPAFGMMGTLIGLIMMLGTMDPNRIGPSMAVALLTTFYGAFAANMVCLPLADKLAFFSAEELLRMEVLVRGVISIQSGENPRLIKQKLMTFVPPSARPVEDDE